MFQDRWYIRPTALVLSALLTFSGLPARSVLAADEGAAASGESAQASGEVETISISSAAELMQFAQNCSLDTWSQGKRVVLKADIDLEGKEFTPIPTFGGVFEGNGHTISGLCLTEGASYQGLFRYIQESGVVQHLQVTGSVAAVGEQAYLGGIAGSNNGKIFDCSFEGNVRGKLYVGGIAGINEATGSIYQCGVDGTVIGEQGTGGISGENNGVITGCVNRSAVNTVHQEKEMSLADSLTGLTKEDLLDTTTDTGGITGYSSGVLQSCKNEGPVGYSHVGYNVGGVVGRSSGYVESCSNAGRVLGRKDVGGVAGQLAPNIRLIFDRDTLDEMQDELSRLNTLVDTALDHTENSGDVISDRLNQISDYTRSATDNASDLSKYMVDWVDDSIETVNNAASILADVFDGLEEAAAGGEGALNDMAGGIDGLSDGLEKLANAMGLGEEAMDSLAGCIWRLRLAYEQAQEGIDAIRRALRELSGALAIEDPDAVREALQLLEEGTAQLSQALQQMGAALDEIAALLQEFDPASPELEQQLQLLEQYLEELRQGVEAAGSVADQIGEAVLGCVNGAEIDWDAVRRSAAEITGALMSFSQIGQRLSDSLEALQNAFSGFGDMSGELEGGLGDFSGAMDSFTVAAKGLGNVFGRIYSVFEDLADREPVEFDTLGRGFHRAEDSLHDAIAGLGDQMDLLKDDVSASGDTLSADIRSIGDQFQTVSDVLVDAVSNAQNKDREDIWSDVSEEEINETTLGKAKGCVNAAAVEGDLNVGGIVGAMAIEVDYDPEDDITEIGEKSYNFRYETRAILQECVNNGAVTSKKNAAGGVVGRMDLGYILNCENYGNTESADGSYTGGIAGISNSTIRGSWAKCSLSGRNYVGGIAGYGYGIHQCVSLVSVTESEGYTGSIVGDWDRENGSLSENRFVEGSLAGVDGISYAGKAEPVAYRELMQEEGVPEPFGYFTLTYVAEDQAVESAVFSYGEPLSSHKAPAVPEKEGYYGIWQEAGEEYITFDHLLEAVYTPYATTLASETMRDEVHAVFLVEGRFDSGAVLQTQLLEHGDTWERWSITLTGETGAEASGEEHVVRFAPAQQWGESISLRLLSANGEELSWNREGSYCVFRANGSEFVLEASFVDRKAGWWKIALGALALLAAVVCGVLVLRKRNMSRMKKRQALEKATGGTGTK